jgi:hypothetical protein
MGFGIGIGIGWPNASASAEHVPTERYLLASCTGVTFDCTTPDFPTGTYVVGDRLRYEFQGFSQFGKVNSITTSPEQDVIDIYPTGVNTSECFDNQLDLYSTVYVTGSDNIIYFDYVLKTNISEFGSSNSEYAFTWGFYQDIYYEYYSFGEFYSGVISITRNGTLNDYYLYVEGGSEVRLYQEELQIPEADFISNAWIIGGYSNNPYIANTYSFTNAQDECFYPYFMRINNGFTFVINYTPLC